MILKEGLNVRVVLLPDGDDPDSYSQKHNLEEVQAFLQANEQDFIEYKTDLLLGQSGNDPLKKAELINDIADTIALIPDQIKRAVYVQSAAVKFGINEDALYARILNTRQKMIDDERKEAERERMREERQARANAGPQSLAPMPAVNPFLILRIMVSLWGMATWMARWSLSMFRYRLTPLLPGQMPVASIWKIP